MNGSVRLKEVFGCKTKRSKAELMQSSNDLPGIVFIKQNPNIEVLGIPGMAMKSHSMTAYNQVVDVIIV